MGDDTEAVIDAPMRSRWSAGTTVRVYFFDRMFAGTSPAQNGIACLNWPYLQGEVLTVDRPMSTKPAPSKACYVLVQTDAPVNFEAVPHGRDNKVTGNSPVIVGNVILPCGPDWTFQFLNTEG